MEIFKMTANFGIRKLVKKNKLNLTIQTGKPTRYLSILLSYLCFHVATFT